MTYTSHGHRIAGSPTDSAPSLKVARCGGPGLCGVCTKESALWTEKNKMAQLNMKLALEGIEGHEAATSAHIFTTKPVDVIAIQFTGGPANGYDIVNWVKRSQGNASYVESQPPYRPDGGGGHDGWPETIQLQAHHGWVEVMIGEWVIQSHDGHFSTCDTQKFELTYKPKE